MEEWRATLRELDGQPPPALQAALALDAPNVLAVLQHASWLGRLLAASTFPQAGLTIVAYLAAVNLGLKTVRSIGTGIASALGFLLSAEA